eukprot:3246560-Rhodomonas_salina.3
MPANDAPYMAHAVQLQELSFRSANNEPDDEEESDTANLSPQQNGKKTGQWILCSGGAESGCLSSDVWSFSVASAPKPMEPDNETRSYPFIEKGYRPTSSTTSTNLRRYSPPRLILFCSRCGGRLSRTLREAAGVLCKHINPACTDFILTVNVCVCVQLVPATQRNRQRMDARRWGGAIRSQNDTAPAA